VNAIRMVPPLSAVALLTGLAYWGVPLVMVDGASMWAARLSIWTACVLYSVIAMSWYWRCSFKVAIRDLGLHIGSWKSVGLGLVASAPLVCARILVGTAGDEMAVRRIDGVWVLIAGVGEALPEELVFRGVVLCLIVQRHQNQKWVAYGTSTGLFVIAHLAVGAGILLMSPSWILHLVVLSMVACKLWFLANGSIWPAVLWHGLWNASSSVTPALEALNEWGYCGVMVMASLLGVHWAAMYRARFLGYGRNLRRTA
jgi:hypothetical protein